MFAISLAGGRTTPSLALLVYNLPTHLLFMGMATMLPQRRV